MKSAQNESSSSPTQRGRFLSGVLVGIGLSLIIAAIVAFFVYRSGTPFKLETNPNPPSAPSAPAVAAPAKPADSKPSVEGKISFPGNAPSEAAKPAAPIAEPAKPTAPLKTEPPAAAAELKKPTAVKAEPVSPVGESKPLFLQAGAFSNKSDAENRRAMLALMGLEGKVTEITKDDKPLYRVRVGPFESPEDATKARSDMSRNGIDSVLIK